MDELPDEMIYELCLKMDTAELYNTIQVSSRYRDICQEILDLKFREEHQASVELKNKFVAIICPELEEILQTDLYSKDGSMVPKIYNYGVSRIIDVFFYFKIYWSKKPNDPPLTNLLNKIGSINTKLNIGDVNDIIKICTRKLDENDDITREEISDIIDMSNKFMTLIYGNRNGAKVFMYR